MSGTVRVPPARSRGSGCHMRCRRAASVRGVSPDCAGRAESLVPPNRPVMRLAGFLRRQLPGSTVTASGVGTYEPSHAIGSAQA